MKKSRKIYFVMAGGGQDTDRHYYETIKTKRSVSEFGKFLNEKDVALLKEYSHGQPYAVWGAIPGPSNVRNWEAMEEGDYVMVYRQGEVILAAEIAMKARNAPLAKYLWQENSDGQTWEYVYFMINDVAVNVPIGSLNKYLGYQSNYHPQGFMAIDQAKTDVLLSEYGDLISVLQRLENGGELEKVVKVAEQPTAYDIGEKIERATTEHDEMQWRLINIGLKAHVDIWIPRNDQGKSYEGNEFRPKVLKEFQETLDVPTTIKNIDVVWKFGYSIKSAFEIENSTSVYSGILRLSDLRAVTPNSTYPLFIVAAREKKDKVFRELKRPTFSNPFLGLDRIVSFLSYDKVREIDSDKSNQDANITTDFLMNYAEKVTG